MTKIKICGLKTEEDIKLVNAYRPEYCGFIFWEPGKRYITPDKAGLQDLYNKFVKYIINYHFKKLYQLTSRSFLANQPVYNNQKDVFIRRVENLGFGDILKKYDLKLDI